MVSGWRSLLDRLPPEYPTNQSLFTHDQFFRGSACSSASFELFFVSVSSLNAGLHISIYVLLNEATCTLKTDDAVLIL